MSGPAAETLIDVLMPQMGVSVTEGTVIAWTIGVGDPVTRDQTLCEISTDKVETELPAPASGVLAEILVGVEETVPVGTPLARIATTDPAYRAPRGSASSPTPATPPQATAATDSSPVEDPGPLGTRRPKQASRYSPVVERLAETHGVDLTQVQGSGRDGRVNKRDVAAFVDRLAVTAGSPRRDGADATAPISGQLPRMRRVIADRMRRSLATAAHCHTWIDVDMSRIEAARKSIGTTALPFVARATIDALRTHPALNAWLEGDNSTLHEEVHLGIAVSLGEDGLIVPVIHNAHKLTVEGIAERIGELVARARTRALTPDEVSGATFTITNPGRYGSLMAAPIIDLPQVGILDLEAITKRAVIVEDDDGNDEIAIRPMTILGLAWDHRALDGALAAQFLATVKGNLES